MWPMPLVAHLGLQFDSMFLKLSINLAVRTTLGTLPGTRTPARLCSSISVDSNPACSKFDSCQGRHTEQDAGLLPLCAHTSALHRNIFIHFQTSIRKESTLTFVRQKHAGRIVASPAVFGTGGRTLACMSMTPRPLRK